MIHLLKVWHMVRKEYHLGYTMALRYADAAVATIVQQDSYPSSVVSVHNTSDHEHSP
jgi:hypothetical protein